MMSSPGADVDLYDAITVRFNNGALGNFSGSGSLPADNQVQVDIRIFGTEGALFLDLERARFEVRRHDGYRFADPLAADAGTYDCAGPPNNFIDLILGKTHVNFAPGEAAMRSVELIDTATTARRRLPARSKTSDRDRIHSSRPPSGKTSFAGQTHLAKAQ